MITSTLLALALLTSDAPVKTQDVDGLTLIALQQIAVSMEIMDPREARYILNRPEDVQADLKLVRRRYQELLDAPSICDAVRFPDRDIINDLLMFNRRYKQYMEQRLLLDRLEAEEVNEVIKECDQLYQIWDTIRDARCDYYYVTVRRAALKKLLDMIGPQAYYAGTLPSHVPLWGFNSIN
jgi:hypothetical protein